MNTRVVIGALIAVLVVAVGGILAIELSKDDQQDSDTVSTNQSSREISMHEEYPDVPEDNRFIKESAQATIQRYKEGSGVIFLGFKECGWCQQVAPVINQAAEAEDIDIYYLDIRGDREDKSLEYQELVSILTPYLAKDESGNPRVSVPDISFVKNGEIFERFEMESATEEERSPEAYWTDERKERAVQRFRDQMKTLKEE